MSQYVTAEWLLANGQFFKKNGVCYYVDTGEAAAVDEVELFDTDGIELFDSCEDCEAGSSGSSSSEPPPSSGSSGSEPSGGSEPPSSSEPPPVPDVCVNDDHPASVEISGYTDGLIAASTACPSCDASADPAWDGVFDTKGASCNWNSSGNNSIDGKILISGGTNTSVRLLTGDRWEMTITSGLDGGGGTIQTLWTGEKTTGSGPAGVYTRTGGLASSPATLTVVATP